MKVGDLVAVTLGAYRGCAMRITGEHVHSCFSSPGYGIGGTNLPGFSGVIVDGNPAYIGRKLRVPVQYFQPIEYAADLENFLAADGFVVVDQWGKPVDVAAVMQPVSCQDDVPYGC